MELGAYGFGYDELFGFEEKLSYICTDIISDKIDEGDTEEDALLELEATGLVGLLQEELGVTQIKIQNIHDYCYIDYQSIGTVPNILRCDYAQNTIIDFLVDDNIMVLITNDNRYKNRFDKLVHIIDANNMYNDKSAVETLENVEEWKKYDD